MPSTRRVADFRRCFDRSTATIVARRGFPRQVASADSIWNPLNDFSRLRDSKATGRPVFWPIWPCIPFKLASRLIGGIR